MPKDRSSIAIRDAHPTYEAGLAFARCLDEAFEGLFGATIGRRAPDVVARVYALPDHDFSYRYTAFAECGGAIVGMATGYTAEQHRRHSDHPLKQAAGNRVRQWLGVRLLCARLSFLGTHVDGDFHLQAIAVYGEMRGKGIGSALMDAIEERARAGGSTRLLLDAAARNAGARRFYERRGMTVEPGRMRLQSRFIVQMTKPL